MRWFESSRPSVAPAAMSVPTLERMIAAFEAGDLDGALGLFSESAVYREPRKEPVLGRVAIAEHWDAFTRSGVRWKFLVDRVIADGADACIVYRFAMAKGPDQAWRERAGCATIRLDAHGLIEEWREYDG